MKPAFTLALICLCSLTTAVTGKPQEFHLEKVSPYSNPQEVKLRFRSRENPGAFDIQKEKYTLLIPPGVGPKTRCGLFVWINAGDTPKIPEAWKPVLAKRKLIFIGAHKSGNRRSIFDRFRLAIEAAVQLPKRFNIDPKRIYVSGFSGGGRVASCLGVAYPDLFAGTLPFMGVNFYQNITAPSGRTYRLNYLPHKELLAIAKKNSRFVLVTGSKDFNREGTKAIFDSGFQKEKFANAAYLEVPGLAHHLPGPVWFEKALKMLDGPLTPPRQ